MQLIKLQFGISASHNQSAKSLLPIQCPANGFWEVMEDDTTDLFFPFSRKRDPDGAPGFWFRPSLALVRMIIWRFGE